MTAFIELVGPWIVCAIIVGAWAFIAHTVWSDQQAEHEHLVDDVKWEPRAESKGRRE